MAPTIQEILPTREAAIARARELFKSDATVCVIESFREPGKFFVENGSPMIRVFERVIWREGKEVKS